MNEIIHWITTRGDELLAIVGALVLAVSGIVKLTATTKDDTVWAKVLKVLSALSLVNPNGSVVGKRTE
jgi:hypothetical protein